MRNLDRPRSHTSAPVNPDRRISDLERPTASALRPELLSEAVVAGYIHDISARHGHGLSSQGFRRERGDRN